MQFVGAALLIAGTVFAVIGVYGFMVTFKNAYERLHASGTVVTLGLVLILAGVAVLQPAVWTKVVVLIGFMMLTSPVAGHAIAKAAHNQHLPAGQRDDLAEARKQQAGD